MVTCSSRLCIEFLSGETVLDIERCVLNKSLATKKTAESDSTGTLHILVISKSVLLLMLVCMYLLFQLYHKITVKMKMKLIKIPPSPDKVSPRVLYLSE